MPPAKSVLYSLPYLILAAFYLLLALNYSASPSKNKRIICIVLFFLFFGLRGFVAWDWHSYYPLFEDLQPLYGNVKKNFEFQGDVGFTLFATIIRTFTSSYQIFIAINVFIDCIVLNVIFKRYSTNYPLSFAIYLFVCMAMQMDTLRSLKAMELFLLAIPSIQERNLKTFLIIILLSISFHASAILYLPCYWILNRYFNKKYIIIYLLFINLIYLLQVPFLAKILIGLGSLIGGRIEYLVQLYLNSDLYSASRGITPSYIERLLTSILIILYYDKIIGGRRGNIVFLNMMLIYFGVVLLGSEMTIIETRVGAMFIFAYTIIWPAILFAIKRFNNYKVIMTWFYILCLVFISLRTNNIMYKYENQLTGSSTYSERARIFDYYSNINK